MNPKLSQETLTKKLAVSPETLTRTLLTTNQPQIKTVKQMKKAVSLLLVLVLVTASCLILASPVKAASRTIVVPDDYSTTQQDSQQTQLTQTQEPKSLPSPLIIAALIIALVALFGAILSLYLRWRDNKKLKK
jgi:hypothetical protein